jgi:VanZ family protein
MIKKTILFIFLIAWMLAIASLSNEIGDESKYRGTQAAKIVKIFISNSNMHIDNGIDIDDEALVYVIRKMGHVLTYLVLALLIHTLLRHTKLGRSKVYIFTLIFSLICACLDEYNQLHVSGRDGTIMDIMIDSIGIIGALIVSSTISQIKAKLYEKT